MPNVQKQPVIDPAVSLQTQLNINELAKQVGSVFSRDNLAVSARTLSADTTLSFTDSVVYGDTSSGNVTLTLPYANGWGSTKTPFIAIVKTSTSNTLTIAPQSGDTLTYWQVGTQVSGNITSTGVLFLVSDGSSTWYALSGIGTSVTPYYARCRISTTMSGYTTETKVTPLSTSLSGFTNSSDVLTCTNAGLYRLDISAILASSVGADVIYLGYRLNGGTTRNVVKHTIRSASYREIIFTSVTVALAASDTIEFRIQRASGTGTTSLYDDSVLTLIKVAE